MRLSSAASDQKAHTQMRLQNGFEWKIFLSDCIGGIEYRVPVRTTHFQTNRRKNQLVMMIQRACVRMAADVGPRQHAGKARVRIVECEWGFGAQGGLALSAGAFRPIRWVRSRSCDVSPRVWGV